VIFAEADYTPVWNSLIAAALAVVMWLLNYLKEQRDKDRAEVVKKALETQAAKQSAKVAEVKNDLIKSNALQSEVLAGIAETTEHTKEIVNSQRTEMEKKIDDLKDVIAAQDKAAALKAQESKEKRKDHP
jgi:hypothetical protein